MPASTSPWSGPTTLRPRSRFCGYPPPRSTPCARRRSATHPFVLRCSRDGTMAGVEMLIATELSKRFGGFLAVNRVSFEVREGEIVGLIGPNGSGKSTTFNLIAGALRPTTGSIRFHGEDITGLPAHKICHRGIARTFQIPRPFRKLSLIENVMLAAHYGEAGRIDRDEARPRAEAALDLDRLPACTTMTPALGGAETINLGIS